MTGRIEEKIIDSLPVHTRNSRPHGSAASPLRMVLRAGADMHLTLAPYAMKGCKDAGSVCLLHQFKDTPMH